MNQPDQPARLTPSDIGIEPGMNVELFEGQTLQPIGARFWSGTALVDAAEWSEQLRTGAASLGPAVVREAARYRAAQWKQSPAASVGPDWAAPGAIQPRATDTSESTWAKYTREFIARYGLDDEQTSRARNILQDCETQRDRFLQKHRSELAVLEREAHEAGDSAPGSSNAARKLAEKRALLDEFVTEMFEQQLKPRLDRLPTRVQRERANGKLP